MRLADIHAAAFETPWSAEEIDALIAAGAIAIAEEGGFILIREGGGEGEILTLAVHPDRRRLGMGRRLVERAVEAARFKGAQTLFLEVAADNEAAIALYLQAGFEQAGIRRNYYGRPGGAVDALVLRKSLSPHA